MKLSWSHKLFLRINQLMSASSRWDGLVRFCGYWLIWILALSFGIFLCVFFVQKKISWQEIEIVSMAWIISYGLSYGLALLFPHQRPVKELPQIKTVFHTLGTWKSFPSDHTIAVTLFFIFSCFFSFGLLPMIFFGLSAVLVALGRIFGGVHYPRDILGGIAVASFGFALCAFVLPHYF